DGLIPVQQRFAARQGEVSHLHPLRAGLVQFGGQVARGRTVVLVVLLVGVEAVVAVAVALERDEERRRAGALLAGLARGRDGVYVGAAIRVAKLHALRARRAAFLSGFLAAVYRVDLDAGRRDLLHEVLVDLVVHARVGGEIRVLDLR